MLALNAGESGDSRHHMGTARQPPGTDQRPAHSHLEENLGTAYGGIGRKRDAAERGEHGVALLPSQLVPQGVADDAGEKGNPERDIKTHLSSGSQGAGGYKDG